MKVTAEKIGRHGQSQPASTTAHIVDDLPAFWYQRTLPLLDLCFRHRRFLLRLTAAALVAATVLAFVVPVQYESTVRLMSPEQQSQSGLAILVGLSGGSLGPASTLASSLLNMKTPGSVYLAVLGSRTVQDGVVNRFDLRRLYGYKTYADARKKLARRTALEEEKKTGVIILTVSDHDRYRARDMAAEYVNELNRLVNQLSTSSARQERVFLEQRLKSVKEDLDNASQRLSQFSSKNATLDVSSQGKAMIEAAARLQGELVAASSELRGLETIYTGENVRVRSTRARIAELQNQIRKLRGTADESKDGGDSGAQLYPSVRELPLLGVTYYDLYRQVKIQETVYETLTKQYELAKVQEAREIPVVKVLDAPDLAEKRSFPPRLLMIILIPLVTLCGGVAWLAGESMWRRANDSIV